jgi:4,5-dihydroxyphthalate decarboxylase
MTAAGPMKLHTLMARTDRTEALFDGRVQSDLIDLDFDPLQQVTAGFPAMVRHMPYDFGELALLTFLQAREVGKPLTLIPFVLAAEPLHRYAHYDSRCGILRPEELAGKRIGVRSYTQTTGLWIRGFLEQDHGIPLEQQRWVCFQQPHVLEYQIPDFVEQVPENKDLVDMVLDGDIDVAVGLIPAITDRHPELAPLFPKGTGEAWVERNGFTPINHMAVLRSSIHDGNSAIAPELFHMLERAGTMTPHADMRPAGVEANRKGMEMLIRWAVRQQLLREPVNVDDLFDDITSLLGASDRPN